MYRVEIIMPSRNGREILAQCLPGVVDCLDQIDPPATITIVDDASTDGTSGYLAENFPEVNVIRLPHRHGFPGAVNAGAFASSADVLLLLNNDMLPNGRVLEPLLQHFSDPEVAVVGSRTLKWDRETLDVGRRMRTLEKGTICGVGGNEDFPETSHTFFASGGAMAIFRSMYVELGGLDEIYAPGYIEDTDLCYRAWKRGWKILWEPQSTFFHMGGGFFSPRKPGLKRYVRLCKVRYYMRRNAFYFYWKNLTDTKAWREYWKHFPRRALAALVSGDVLYFAGLARAVTRLGDIKRRRRRELETTTVTDAEVFEKLAKPYRSTHGTAQPDKDACTATAQA
ncbi:MAG: glycosyltransferase family 2 protein [Planctomycetes bacterium]|nr:glycosyltransferase family 2 protein [Planctomycetota bacterium]